MTSSQVYYRKWRPQTLADLVGQEPVARTIKQAINRGRIAHAYLFCGPRGTGKTSTARILSKAVNCLEPQEGEPCNTCRMCLAVNEGRAMDLVEIDAASNRGIDEIRNIREKVNYAPVEATHKVYVLDEAHMLTDAAADALLKTLEEPPSHVIFILATTEPHRLSSTIISRCQRFDFRRIAPAAMVERLEQICQAEGIEAEPAALSAITRQASGSLRDAENLLEQAVTSFGSPLTLEQVNLLLGLTADERVRDLVAHILRGEVADSLTLLNTIASEGNDLKQLHRQMVDELRNMLLITSGAKDMVAQPQEIIERQAALIVDVTQEALLQALRTLGQINFRQEVPNTLPIELAIIECSPQVATGPSADVTAASPKQSSPVQPQAAPTTPPQPKQPDTLAEAPPEAVQQPSQTDGPPTPLEEAPSEDLPTASQVHPVPSGDIDTRLDQQWPSIVRTLSRYKGRRFNIGALLRACQHHSLEGNTLLLEFSHRSHMERMMDEMENPESKRTMISTVASALGVTEPLELSFRSPNGQEGRNQARQSPLVQAALGMGGKILEETKE